MSVISFDLNELGFERIGFPKSYGTKKIKDKLKPAINELMIQRVLAEEPKYEKIRPGVWKIEFTRGEFYKQAHMAEALPYKRDEINFVQNLTQKPFELAENQVRKILDVYRKKDGKIEISVLLNQIKRLEQKLKEDKSRGVGYVYKALLEKWDLSKVSETEKKQVVIETYTREQKAKDQETEKLAAKEREEKEWLDKVFEELAEDKKVELKAEARRRAKEQSRY